MSTAATDSPVPDHAGAGHRRRLVIGVIVVVVALAGTVGLVAASDGPAQPVLSGDAIAGSGPVAPTTATALANGRWSALPPGPMVTVAAAAWTGHVVFTVGQDQPFGRSESEEAAHPARAMAATFDPASRRWRRVAPPPFAPSNRETLVSTPDGFLLWVVADPAYDPVPDRGARFDEATGTWRLLPTPPTRVVAATMMWTGRQLVVTGWQPTRTPTTSRSGCPEIAADAQDPSSPDVVVYDPARDRWQALPAPPAHRGQWVDQVIPAWAGGRLLEWWEWNHSTSTIGARGDCESQSSDGLRLVSFDPHTRRWSALAQWTTEGPGPVGITQAIATQHGVVLPSALRFYNFWPVAFAGDPGNPLPGSVYDPARGTYEPMTQGPVGDSTTPSIWCGESLLTTGRTNDFESGSPLTAAWDPNRNTWTTVPPAPTREGWSVAVWTGRELVTFSDPPARPDQPAEARLQVSALTADR